MLRLVVILFSWCFLFLSRAALIFYGVHCAYTPVLVELFRLFLCFLVFARLLLIAAVGLHGRRFWSFEFEFRGWDSV